MFYFEVDKKSFEKLCLLKRVDLGEFAACGSTSASAARSVIPYHCAAPRRSKAIPRGLLG